MRSCWQCQMAIYPMARGSVDFDVQEFRAQSHSPIPIGAESRPKAAAPSRGRTLGHAILQSLQFVWTFFGCYRDKLHGSFVRIA